MVQVEMFEEEDSSILQEEINKFLEKINKICNIKKKCCIRHIVKKSLSVMDIIYKKYTNIHYR